jgi:hypothetical protein
MNKLLIVTLMLSCCLVIAGAASAQDFKADLDGIQEVPPNSSPGTGRACFSLDPVTLELSYDISFSGLIGVETAAHIHGPAPVGQNAGVVFPLPLGSPKLGTVGPLTAAQIADLTGGLMYVNIHTDFRPGGEIRGQIVSGLCPPVQVNTTTWGEIKALYREDR